MVVMARVIGPMNSMVCSNGGKILTHAMVVANSTNTYARVNDRWSGLIVQVRTKLCGLLNQKRSIRVGTIGSMKMTTDRAQQHNSTSGNRAKNYHVLKKFPPCSPGTY